MLYSYFVFFVHHQGKTYIGSIQEGQRICEFIVIQNWINAGKRGDPEIKTNSTYDVLVTNKGVKDLSGWTWAAHQLGETTVPANAIKCGTSGDGDGCYIGMSIYADAICDETIGKIHMTLQLNKKVGRRYGLAYVIEHFRNEKDEWAGEGGTCAFFQFLTFR